jgi:hypothetical protein
LLYYPHFGIFYKEKAGNPEANFNCIKIAHPISAIWRHSEVFQIARFAKFEAVRFPGFSLRFPGFSLRFCGF